ncbi:hypothetical protein [Pseudomonas baetica]|jgi:hypothetical protein|uniref:hypothetical protein n=1 Tax=Pseudomonas baetica TaxID=674054 RepID=UPI002404EFE2|nr:hypothetical protein [Pseudomonas baetica]MDF9778998.1 hypothetical protein [Pseudomonas baetica]
MYAKHQLADLFSLIEAIQGSEQDNNSGALTKLREEADRLKAQDQRLMLGMHQHRHGQSQYLFLVPAEKAFGSDDFEKYLQEEFEPDLEEELELVTMNKPIEIE